MSDLAKEIANNIITKMQEIEENYILTKKINNCHLIMKNLNDLLLYSNELSFDDHMYLSTHPSKHLQCFMAWRAYKISNCDYGANRYKEAIELKSIIAIRLFLEEISSANILRRSMLELGYIAVNSLYENYLIFDAYCVSYLLNFHCHLNICRYCDSKTNLYGHDNGYTLEHMDYTYRCLLNELKKLLETYRQEKLSLDELKDIEKYIPGGSKYELVKSNFHKKLEGLDAEEIKEKYEFTYDVFNDHEWELFNWDNFLWIQNYGEIIQDRRLTRFDGTTMFLKTSNPHLDEIKKLSNMGEVIFKNNKCYAYTPLAIKQIKARFYKKLLDMKIEGKILVSRINEIRKQTKLIKEKLKID